MPRPEPPPVPAPTCVLVVLTLAGIVAALGTSRPAGRDDGGGPIRAALRVDPNTAPIGVLEALPRIGPALARRIVEARPFGDADDLDARVPGIGPATMAGIRPHLRFRD